MEPVVIWDPDDDPDGNVAHVAEDGVTREEVEEVVQNEDNETDASASSGRPRCGPARSRRTALGGGTAHRGRRPPACQAFRSFHTPPDPA